MPPRQRALPTDFDSRLARIVAADGRQALAGMSRIGAGRSGRDGQSVLTDVGRGEDQFAAQLLVLSAVAASVTPGGDYVDFDTIVAQHGFDGVPRPSGNRWVHPITGVYTATYVQTWDSHRGGGEVRLAVNGQLVPAGYFGGGRGRKGHGTVHYWAAAGSSGQIWVSHDDAAAQTCQARVSIAITDPAGVGSSRTTFGVGDPTATVLVPASVRSGDLLIAHAVSTEPTVSTPTGWTRLIAAQNTVDPGDDPNASGAIDWKIADADDAGKAYAWTGSGGSFRTSLGVAMHRITGADAVSPFAGAAASHAPDWPQTSLSTSTSLDVAGDLLALVGTMSIGDSGIATPTFPVGFSDEYNVSGSDGGADFRAAAASKAFAAGATGAVTVELNIGNNHAQLFLVPIRPAA